MDKKYIIALVIGIVLWAGFMAFRHNTKQGDTNAYFEKMNRQVTEAAKKAPRAGLTEVGTALQSYYEENKAYPAKLMDLVPKYLANKSLIQEIDWHYEPRGDDFYLSKTLILGDQRIVASVDKGLRPEADTGVMIATPKRPSGPKAAGKAPIPEKVELSTETRLALARENLLNALRRGAFDVSAVSKPDKDEERLIAAVMPRVISESEGSDLEIELGQHFLVWKGSSGVLGFSNVQYPESDRMSVYVYGRWFDVKMPTRTGEASPVLEIRKPELEAIAAKLQDGYLVWKDHRGTVGFGNVQYPQGRLAAVFEREGWLAVESQPFLGKTVSEDQTGRTEKKSLETIASEIGNQFLVWKDDQGAVGFGNVQYPGKGVVSVFQASEWISMTERLLVQEKGAPEGQRVATKKSSDEMLASEFAREFLVWKDKNGTLGFGNVQYPAEGLESVYDVDSWTQAKRAVPGEALPVAEGDKASGGRSPEGLAEAFSTRYLVWKDKRGVLGFGNVQYPEYHTITGVHIDGSWEPVRNSSL